MTLTCDRRTLGITRNAVRVRMYRARKRFTRALADAGIDLPLFERSTLWTSTTSPECTTTT
ncbi:hypothetical protein B0I32_1412 [Nonomuraea fuscirosea]|uniref:Uncharacterized protein n=1 Tax=Nonomuraea fuscirosea TaxID=1291556 RepID=A0A2T0LVV2_9ACTN|nr:hypothetical protein B0I32_1412 [Nonomuraea fuscirosea]